MTILIQCSSALIRYRRFTFLIRYRRFTLTNNAYTNITKYVLDNYNNKWIVGQNVNDYECSVISVQINVGTHQDFTKI